MAIYRGVGGAGEANDDATLNAVTEQAQNAADSASEAATSATAAASSASAAATSATNAASSESSVEADATAAASSASSAASSATTASTAATNAGTAQTAAETAQAAAEAAQTAAETAETNAETAETNAASSASAASSSAGVAALNATSAADSASSAASSASAAASSASAAASEASDAATSATEAASSASAASTSETNAASSASAASTSASNASTSETNAAASETAAATSETNAATSASNASTSETNAATSASNASTSETNAAASASSASTSATNAASSASSAATSASNASASADAALAALDNFDDRYLGQKTSDPTLDNDGNALVAGALYFNTTDDVMKVYEGSSWVAAYASLSGALLSANNLSDLNNASTARTNLGLGTAATTAATDYATSAQGSLADSALQPADIGSTVQGYDATILTSSDIGSTVQGYDAGTLTSADIGSTVQGYDADTAKYDDATAAFTGNLSVDTDTLYVDSTNDKVGINTSSPAATVEISHSGSATALRMGDAVDPSAYTGMYLRTTTKADISIGSGAVLAFNAGGGGLERMRIDSSGNVGIGTSSPTGILSIVGASSDAWASSSAGGLTLNGTSGSEVSTISTYLDNSSIRIGAGVTQKTGLFINGQTASGGSYVSASTGGAERMRIDSSGNVGIGTDSPSVIGSGIATLDLKGNSSSQTDRSGGIRFTRYDGTSAMRMYHADGTSFIESQSTYPLLLATNGSEAMRIDSSGRVGIGTSSPTEKLTIAGNIGFDNAYRSIYFPDDGTTYSGRIVGDDGTYKCVSIQHNHHISFYTGGTGGSGNVTERMRIDSSGRLLVGTTTATHSGVASRCILKAANNVLGVVTDSGNTQAVRFTNGTTAVGSINLTTSATSYTTSSDYRLKEDWQPMSGSIDRVKSLNPVNFAWKANGSRVDGFLAHEMQEVVPEAVTGEKDAMRTEEYEVTPAVLDDDGNVVEEAVMGEREVPDYQGIDQSKLTPLLTAALQEAIARIESLEAEVTALKGA